MASDISFYVLQPDRGSLVDTEFFKTEPILRGDAPQCSACGRFLGMRRWLSPRRAQIVIHGDAAGDFAFASSSEFLVSERAKSVIERERVGGLTDIEEIEISSTLRTVTANLGRYFHVEVTQRAGDFDPELSHVERTTPSECPRCLGNGIAAIQGFVIEPGTWSGADVFVPRGLSGVVVVTESFREVVEIHQLSNADFVPTELFTWVPFRTG